MTENWLELERLLLMIHAQLDESLSLDVLAASIGSSRFRVHRMFKALLGESPRNYVERMRLEYSAFRLMIQDADVITIAFDCGFTNPDTFARAFRRRFGRAPSEWRRWASRQPTTPPLQNEVKAPIQYSLSRTRLLRIRPLHLATVRHLGPYEDVPDSIFEKLQNWSTRRRLTGPPVWMGMGLDAPSVSASHPLRFDACLVVPAPFASEGEVVHRFFPGGEFALTTHVGPYHTLPAAYAQIMNRYLQDARFSLRGLPAVEIYHTAQISVRAQLNHTDICLPVALRTAVP